MLVLNIKVHVEFTLYLSITKIMTERNINKQDKNINKI